MVILCFNVGSWKKTGDLGKALTKGDKLGAALQFPHFNKATLEETGQFGPWAGLTFRRYSEMWLFLTGELVFAQTWPLCDQFLKKIKAYYKQKNYPEQMPYPDCKKENMIA